MKVKFCTVFTVITLGLGASGYGQDSTRIAREMFDMGMQVFDYTNRLQAKDMFIQATEFDPGFARAFFMAGKSILLTVHKNESLPYFLKARELDPDVDEEISFYIGRAYQYSMKFDEAIKQYDRYRKKLERSLEFKKSQKIFDVDWKIFECRNAKVFTRYPVKVKITDLPDQVNTEYPDYAPIIASDESKLYFTSRRPDNANPDLADDQEFFEDIYFSDIKNLKYKQAKPIGPPLNSLYHNSCIGLSPDGKTIYVYSDENGGDILDSRFDESTGRWSEPKPVKGFINSEYQENSATISADNRTMYFTSDRPDGYGGSDIYKSKLQPSGRWGQPVNLGPDINTARDEEAPFLSFDGKSLYFSSDGLPGMGELDIFKATRMSESDSFALPVNLGYPINSVENDVFFVLTRDEKKAYYSSVKSTSKGDLDIYSIDMTKWVPLDMAKLTMPDVVEDVREVSDVTAPKSTKTSLSIRVIDEATFDSLSAKVVLIDQATNKSVEAAPGGTGIYNVTFVNKSYTVYDIKISCKGYLPYSSKIHVIGKGVKDQQIKETVALQRLVPTTTGIMNVYFGLNSDQPNNLEDIQYLELLLKENPTVSVEIGGHTDNSGSPAYNKDLSQRRANAVKAYLVAQGIDEGRIEAKGYGMEKPIANNETRRGRRLNRRTEFKLLSNYVPLEFHH